MAINYDAIIKRANKMIDKASSRIFASCVHIVDEDTPTDELQGLVIIKTYKKHTPNISHENQS